MSSAEYMREWRAKHPERAKEISKNANRKWLSEPKNKEIKRAFHREYRRNHPYHYSKKEHQAAIKRLQKLKEKFVEIAGGKCEKCGYKKSIAALDFHHEKPKPNGITAKDKEWRKLSFEEKIRNGEVLLLCSNCHREKHHGVD